VSVVHLVVPDGFDLPSRPSGGNLYDRRLAQGLVATGWCVRVWPVAGTWRPVGRVAEGPLTDRHLTDVHLTDVLAAIPDAAVVLVDGLVASRAGAELLPHSGRLRVVVLVHQPTPDATREADERAVLGAARAVVTTSEWTRQRLVERDGVPPSRVSVAVPGVDRAPLTPASASGERLLCVAAVTREKGYDLLLAALGSMVDLQWHCTCVGPLDRDVELVAELSLSTDGAFEASTRMPVTFTGIRVGTALEATYADADLLVLPSRAETYGMVVTEALAHGVPVVATAVGGVAEALGAGTEHGQAGVLVPPDDAEALASALRSWLGDGDLRRRWRAAARERRTTLPRWSETARRVAQVLCEAAA
jgi:glycosyltransferase involved in cell wall biosynthesis